MAPINLKLVANFIALQVLFTSLATVSFAIFWHFWVPNTSSIHEVQLGFTSIGSNGRSYSTDSFPLSESGYSFFTSGQKYSVEMSLVIPDCSHNRDVDFSLVKLHLHSSKGNVSRTLANSVLPTYRPWLIDTMDTIVYAPLYFSRIWRKEERLKVVLSSNFIDDPHFPADSGRLELETNGLRWYSATLVIYAVLNPILWYIYRNPLLVSFVCIVSTTFTLNCLLLLKTLLKRLNGAEEPKMQPQIGEIVGKAKEEQKNDTHKEEEEVETL